MTVWGHLVFASRAGTKSASSEFFHLMRNINSPEESVAPMMRSGSSLRSNPRGASSPPFFFFSGPLPPPADLRFSASFLVFSLRFRSNSSIISSHSRFSLGSHVLSSSPYPFHLSKYSILPFLPIRLSTTFSTEYSSSSLILEIGFETSVGLEQR